MYFYFVRYLYHSFFSTPRPSEDVSAVLYQNASVRPWTDIIQAISSKDDTYLFLASSVEDAMIASIHDTLSKPNTLLPLVTAVALDMSSRPQCKIHFAAIELDTSQPDWYSRSIEPGYADGCEVYINVRWQLALAEHSTIHEIMHHAAFILYNNRYAMPYSIIKANHHMQMHAWDQAIEKTLTAIENKTSRYQSEEDFLFRLTIKEKDSHPYVRHAEAFAHWGAMVLEQCWVKESLCANNRVIEPIYNYYMAEIVPTALQYIAEHSLCEVFSEKFPDIFATLDATCD